MKNIKNKNQKSKKTTIGYLFWFVLMNIYG